MAILDTPFLQLDTDGVMASAIGSGHGIDEHELFRTLKNMAGLHQKLASDPRAGFLRLPRQTTALTELEAIVATYRGSFDALLVIGVGGSSLGLRTIDRALRPSQRSDATPTLRFLDNTDPDTLDYAFSGLEPARTLCVAISKSGNTVDTLAGLAYVHDWYLRSNLPLRQHVIAICERPGGALGRYADQHALRRFDVPADVGGRFSVLCNVGLLPALLLGYDAGGLLEGARSMLERAEARASKPEDNPALVYAAAQHMLSRERGKGVSVLLPYAPRLSRFCDWYTQLWCESLGKASGKDRHASRYGQDASGVIGASAQHSVLQLMLDGPNSRVVTLVKVRNFDRHLPFPASSAGFDFKALGIADLAGRGLVDLLHAQLEGTREALREQERPVLQLSIERLNAKALGAMLMFYELATAYLGVHWGLNPFDQPAVELGKRITRQRLAADLSATEM